MRRRVEIIGQQRGCQHKEFQKGSSREFHVHIAKKNVITLNGTSDDIMPWLHTKQNKTKAQDRGKYAHVNFEEEAYQKRKFPIGTFD